MSPETNTSSKDIVTDFVKLTLGKTRILIPNSELMSIESNINLKYQTSHISGFTKHDGAKIPVYAFDEDLQPIPVKDSCHQVCVLLEDGKDRIGILCDDAGEVALNNVELHDLPDCMLGTITAIHNIAVSNNTLYCVSNIKCFLLLIKNSGIE